MFKAKIKGMTEKEADWLCTKLKNEFDDREMAKSIMDKMVIKAKREPKQIVFTISDDGYAKNGDRLYQIQTLHSIAEGESRKSVRSRELAITLMELSNIFAADGYLVSFVAEGIEIPEDE